MLSKYNNNCYLSTSKHECPKTTNEEDKIVNQKSVIFREKNNRQKFNK